MNILDKILKVKKEEVQVLRSDFPLSRFADSPFFSKKPLSLIERFRSDRNISIIAEVKKASPSKGILVENFDHMRIAGIYSTGGADALSILTDKTFFMGDIKYLREIASIKTTPLLRKDFIIDPLQILEARSNGADAVLLIAEALGKWQIKELTSAAQETDMEVLLELHSSAQLEKIDFSSNKLIGINNRNLESFVTDLNTTKNIAGLLPDDVFIVSESGINSRADLEIIQKTKASAILVGEYFMKSADISKSLQEFKQWCRNEG